MVEQTPAVIAVVSPSVMRSLFASPGAWGLPETLTVESSSKAIRSASS